MEEPPKTIIDIGDYDVATPQPNSFDNVWNCAFGRLSPFLDRRIKKADRKRAIRAALADNPNQMKPVDTWFNTPEKKIEAIYKYYDYLRKEIDREDSITFSRITITLSFQAFLLGASAFIFSAIVNAIPSASDPLEKAINLVGINYSLMLSGIVALIGISLVGAWVAVKSHNGIRASRSSLSFAKDQWIQFNRLNGYIYPNLVPQPTKYATLTNSKRHQSDQGSDFALGVPRVLIVFWSALVLLWLTLLLLTVALVGPSIDFGKVANLASESSVNSRSESAHATDP